MLKILVLCVLLCTLKCTKAQANLPCVVLPSCPAILTLFDNPSQLEEAEALVQKYSCGKDGNLPKVRCPDACQTPNGYSGFCEPIEQCNTVKKIESYISQNSPLVKMIPRDYMLKFACTIPGEQQSVCCPIHEDLFESNLYSVTSTELLPDFDKNECGLSGEDRIVRGTVAELNDFPWTALLHYDSNSDIKTIRCAGSLINDKYVVTAAHCVDELSERLNGRVNRVTLGEYNLETDIDCIGNTCADPVVVAQVESVIVHLDRKRKQESGLINNDIALIRLAKPVEFTNFIRPVCLPQADLRIPDGQLLQITGWGLTETGNTSSVKLKTEVRVSNKNLCQEKYQNIASITVGDGAFCAEEKEGVVSCSGNSGGPIMLSSVNGNNFTSFILAGIVSFGSTVCGNEMYPNVYTDIPKYMDWIKEIVQP